MNINADLILGFRYGFASCFVLCVLIIAGMVAVATYLETRGK